MAELMSVTVGELLEQQAKQYPDHEALVYYDRGLRLTYEQFNEQCKTVAKGFIGLGIEKGENVAIWASNVPEWVTCQFATGKMGAVLVTVNTSYRKQELNFLLQQSEATTIVLIEKFHDHSYIETLYSVVPELKISEPGKLNSKVLPHLRNVIVLGEVSYPGTYSWNDLLKTSEQVSDTQLVERSSSLHHSDVINMQYTSGTTGFPKGVMLTHDNVINNAYNIAQCMNLVQTDRMCIPVPFFHCFGCVIGTMAAVSVGATMVPLEKFDPRLVLEIVEQENCTVLHGVPTMFIAELNHPDLDSFKLTTLRTGVMAGANCPMEVMTQVIEKMGAKEITIAYGQTEASPVITQTRPTDSLELRTETVGRALPNVEVKIVNPINNEEVPVHTQGELCSRGYHIMKGYYNNEAATGEAIDDEGWLHTGDLATMDEQGYVKITGRLKDMIIRGGENIYPREIEEFLYTHPDVLDVQIVGVPDEKYGEEVMAWVRLKPEKTLTEAELREFCVERISRHKIPRYISFVDQYPMTASGKIQKYKLREQAIEQLK